MIPKDSLNKDRWKKFYLTDAESFLYFCELLFSSTCLISQLQQQHKLKQCKFFPVTLMFCRVRKQQEEDRLQRRVQEEAVKFLWKQVSMTKITR